jgi:hypothetical protein
MPAEETGGVSKFPEAFQEVLLELADGGKLATQSGGRAIHGDAPHVARLGVS